MNLTLGTADIASAKIEEIVVKHESIQEVIRNGTHTYKYIHIQQLPKVFEGFMWRLKGKTMVAIRGENLNFQIVIVSGAVSKYLTNMQAIRKYKVKASKTWGAVIEHERTDESIRLTKTVNNTEATITLNASIIA